MNIRIHTDGGARGNPGPAAVGVVLVAGSYQEKRGRCIGDATNNVAEYTAVLDALSLLRTVLPEVGVVERIDFHLDSQLVVYQITGKYRVKEPNLQELNRQVKEGLAGLSLPYSFNYVPRAQNAEADCLVNQALDGAL